MPPKRAPKVEAAPEPPPAPQVGDKVTLGNSGTVFAISRVNASGTQVDLRLDGTNIERFRVPVGDLTFVETVPRAPSKPPKPSVNVEEVRERLATVQQSSTEQLSGDIAIVKKYLKSKGVPTAAAEELDSLCKAQEDRWKAALERIFELLGE